MSDERVMTAFSWYKAGMRSVGRKVYFPKCSDRSKTYLWRQLNSFINKVDDLGFDDKAARELVYAIIKYGKRNKLLNRGAALLTKVDLLEIFKNKLEEDLKSESLLLDEIKRCQLFLSEQQRNGSINKILIDRKKSGAYANITCWFQSGRLTRSFIALSKNCCRILSKLEDEERSEFPPDITLLKVRALCLQDAQRADKIKQIMGSDLHRRLG